MVSLNKDSSQNDILDEKLTLAMNVEPNDVRPCMFELTNATMMDLTRTSTKIPQMTKTKPSAKFPHITLFCFRWNL